MERLSWDDIWMNMATLISKRSYDPRLKVGAIIVSEDNTSLLSLGYNGNYANGPNEAESLNPGESGMIHAEINALIKCDFNFSKNKVMYLTHSPCKMCAKCIVNARIKSVVFNVPYRDTTGVDILISSGIEVRQFSVTERVFTFRKH